MVHKSVSSLMRAFDPPGGFRRVLLLALFITVPGLFTGLFLDDYGHIASLQGKIANTTPSDLFVFIPLEDNETDVPRLVHYPWYSSENLSIHFWRPLSSLTMALDYRLFGDWKLAYHLHSTIWYLSLCGAALLLYRRLFAPGLAVFALALFVLEDSHVIPALWWSNRNAMISAAPALLGMWAHLRWREDGVAWGLPASLALLVVALLGSEGALGIAGYLGAYELFGRRGPLFPRVACLMPAAAVCVLYLLYYKLQGYGVEGSGVYIDPLHQPGAFLRHAPERVLMLAAAQLANLPVEGPAVAGRSIIPILALSLTAVALVGYAFMGAWRSLSREERLTLRWVIAGAVLSALPSLSTFPSGRLLLLPSFGGCIALAVVVRHLWRTWGGLPRWERALGGALIVLHLLAPIPIWIGLPVFARLIDNRGAAAVLRAELPEDLRGRHVFLLNAQDPLIGLYSTVLRDYHGKTVPDGWTTISMIPTAQRITRTSDRSLEIELLDGEILSKMFEQLFRSPDEKIPDGEAVVSEGVTIRVLESGATGPVRVELVCPEPLEHPRYLFTAWQHGLQRPFVLPPPGESVVLPQEPGFVSLSYLWNGPPRN